MGKNKWKGKSKRKNGESGEKKLPIGVTLLLILLGSVAFVMFCVGTGFMIDAIVAFSTGDVKSGEVAKYMWRIVPVGIKEKSMPFFRAVRCRSPDKSQVP